jgi:hypothetical protein
VLFGAHELTYVEIGFASYQTHVNHFTLATVILFKEENKQIEGIMPIWRINIMTDLQETKFLHLFGLTSARF